MRIRIGYELIYECPNPTPMILMLNVHITRASRTWRHRICLLTDPGSRSRPIATGSAIGATGWWRPPGGCGMWADAVIRDKGLWDPQAFPGAAARGRGSARRDAGLPAGQPLLRDRQARRIPPGSCSATGRPAGAGSRRSATIVHNHITFGYETRGRPGRPPKRIAEQRGVCRDFAHLALAFCRCMNIPARYCTGYISDIGAAAALWPDGLRGLDRGLSRRPLAHVRPAQQRAPHRQDTDRPRPRRRRRAHHPHVRPEPLSSFRVWTDEILPETA